VSELAAKIVKLVTTSAFEGTINVASGVPTSIGKLTELIKIQANSEIRILERSDKPKLFFWADTSLFKNQIQDS
jgi:hypothetical protein